jgi:hypothetical protein
MPYKKVIAVGDSFTRGDELTDCPDQLHEYKFPFQYSLSTWPASIAKLLDCAYECYALGGIGNQWISWKIADKLEQDTLVIVNWTWFERFDYVDIETDLWTTTHPQHEDKLNHFFYRNIDSDIWNLHRNLQQMHSTISLLQQHNIDFIMTCLDTNYGADFHTIRPPGDDTDPSAHWKKAIENLQAQVKHYIVNFYGYSFLEWSKYKNFEFGSNGHPLEKAHTEAAKYINTHVIEGKNYGH